MRRGTTILKEELGQHYCTISYRLKDNGGRFLLRRVNRYYCTRVYYLENAWRWTITFQFNMKLHLIRNSVTSKFQFHFFHTLFQHLIVYSFYNLSKFFSVITRNLVRPHILGRRFALTAIFYKYVNIGFSVELMSSVKIIIGDNRGNQIILLHATWEIHRKTC